MRIHYLATLLLLGVVVGHAVAQDQKPPASKAQADMLKAEQELLAFKDRLKEEGKQTNPEA